MPMNEPDETEKIGAALYAMLALCEPDDVRDAAEFILPMFNREELRDELLARLARNRERMLPTFEAWQAAREAQERDDRP